MFLAKIRSGEGNLNGIEIQKLKEKLGTKQLPTAELLLDGMEAYKVFFIQVQAIIKSFVKLSLN